MKLRQLLNLNRAEKIPPGWYSAETLARREGFGSVDSFRPLLRDAIKGGFLELRHFHVLWGGGVRRRCYYRYKKAA